MPFGTSVEASCRECGAVFPHLKRLSEHLKKAHGLSSLAYHVNHFHGGQRPMCLHCGHETRFVSLGEGFKRYCAADRKVAESLAGKVGGKAKRSSRARVIPLASAISPPIVKMPVIRPSSVVDPNRQTPPPPDIVSFVRSLGFADVETSTGSVISPHVVDVWVPSAGVAIDFLDLSWQGPTGEKDGVFDKRRARLKHLAAVAADVKLLQVFSDEWANRNDVMKSVVGNALHANPTRLDARDCTVAIVTAAQTRPFLDRCHVSGSTRASLHYVLVHKTQGTVGAATVRRPIQKRHGANMFELARMAFELSTTVRGGASKLLARIERDVRDTCDGLLSYAELRFGDGGVYERCGFTRADDSATNYWYTQGLTRMDRFRFRAQPGKPEKQVADENNVRPVYGSGNAVYVKRWASPVVGPTI